MTKEEGQPVGGATVEIRISPAAECKFSTPMHTLQAVSNDNGDYRTAPNLGVSPGLYCVFAWAAGSDSVSTGQVRFTTNTKRTEPPDTLDLDVYVK